MNSIAQAGAIAALDDEAHLRETKRVIDEGRAYLQEQFAEMQIPFVPAAANFLMVNVGDGCAVFQKLLQRKIIVRPLKGYGLPEWVRISVGTMEENRQLIAASAGYHAFALERSEISAQSGAAAPISSLRFAVFGNRSGCPTI